MTDKLIHHELIAEWVDDKHGNAIMLTQPADNYDEPACVLIHPWQLRATCEHFGIIAADPQAAKTIATLKRRMLALRQRVETLHDWLCNHSDHKHADLTYEVTYATATLDLADEYCADFDDTEQPDEKPPQNPAGYKTVSNGEPAEAHSAKQTSLI
jgi:hypothetical protein